MKTLRRTGILISVILVITMLMSVASVGFMAVSAETSLSLGYLFRYENAGYAEGRITLTAGSAADRGKYYLYWADDTKALDGYSEIKAVDLFRDYRSVTMEEFTVIPADATKVIAIRSDAPPKRRTVAAASAVYDIPESKQFHRAGSEVQYTFQALSDIHIQHDDSYWKYSKTHWANALEVAAERDVDFITVCGDQVNGYGYGNLESEWPMYLQILADSSFTGPVYETNGNHEIKGDGGDMAQPEDHKIFNQASGLNVDTDPIQNNSYYEVTGPTGDHFIFMVLETSGAPNDYDEFSAAQLDWLEGLLRKYYGDGHKIFINQHALFRGYGAGDSKETPYYGGALLDSCNGVEHKGVKRLKSLMEQYPEVIMISGHSHFDFMYNFNIDNMDGNTCYTVHVPSTSSTTHPILGSFNAANGHGEREYRMSEDSSQGYFVDVYEDAVIFGGTDLVKNEIMPRYTYMIDYTGVKPELNPDFTEEVYDQVTVNVDVRNLTENPAEVKVKLYGADDPLNVQEIRMTENADGTYSATVSTEFTLMDFLVSAGTGYTSLSGYRVDDCNVKPGGMKIQYSNPSNWGFVNVYAWNKTANQNIAGWPGMAMTKGTDGKYIALIPKDCNPDMIIFNNKSGDNGSQTDDLVITPYVAGVYEDVYEKIEVEKPEESTPDETKPSVTETQPVTTETGPSVTETQPITTQTKPLATETQPITTETSPVVPVKYFYGDADLDEKITIKDATMVQKHTAQLVVIDGKGLIQAEVLGDGDINVKDATAIQKYVALLISSFPVENKAAVAEVGAGGDDLETLITSVKDTLAKEYYYSSYVRYAALKDAYYRYKDAQISSMSDEAVNSAYDVINSAFEDYRTMKENNPSPFDRLGNIYLPGSMNGWEINADTAMKPDGNGVSITYELPAGAYALKVHSGGAWYGNSGNFTDTCTGWTMRGSEGDLEFNLTGGTYKFFVYYSGSNIKLTVTKL